MNSRSRFLGHSPDRVIAQIRRRAPSWFELAEEALTLCSGLLGRIRPRGNDGQRVLVAILYRRLVSSAEAVLLLAERGMHTEALVLRRSTMEALFVLGALWQQPELVSVYVDNDTHRRRDIYKNIRKASATVRNNLGSTLIIDDLDPMIRDLDQQTKGKRYLSVEQFAQAAGLHDHYLTDYCLLSEAAHHVARDLERNIGARTDDSIEAILWGPEREEPFRLLFPTIDHLMMATFVMNKLFKLNIKRQLDQISAKSRVLSEAVANDG